LPRAVGDQGRPAARRTEWSSQANPSPDKDAHPMRLDQRNSDGLVSWLRRHTSVVTTSRRHRQVPTGASWRWPAWMPCPLSPPRAGRGVGRRRTPACAAARGLPLVASQSPGRSSRTHRCSRASAAAARATNHAACISGELLDRVGGLHLAGDQNGSPLVSCYAASCPACDPSQARIE